MKVYPIQVAITPFEKHKIHTVFREERKRLIQEAQAEYEAGKISERDFINERGSIHEFMDSMVMVYQNQRIPKENQQMAESILKIPVQKDWVDGVETKIISNGLFPPSRGFEYRSPIISEMLSKVIV